MRCAECRERLDAYLDGELTPVESEMVRGHVEQCTSCGHEHAVLSATSRRLKDGLMYYEAPDMLRARIVSALSRPAKPADRMTSSWIRWSRLAAAAVVIAVASSGVTVAVLHRENDTGLSPMRCSRATCARSCPATSPTSRRTTSTT